MLITHPLKGHGHEDNDSKIGGLRDTEEDTILNRNDGSHKLFSSNVIMRRLGAHG